MAGIASVFVAPFPTLHKRVIGRKRRCSFTQDYFAEITARLLDRFNNDTSHYSLTHSVAETPTPGDTWTNQTSVSSSTPLQSYTS